VNRPSDRELLLKSLWHLGIAGVGVYEYKHHRTLAARVLAVGLIAFHLDAAWSDVRNQPTTLQKLLHRLA
jgi:hypothetical protein